MVNKAVDLKYSASGKARLLANGGGGKAKACHLLERKIVMKEKWLINTLSSLEYRENHYSRESKSNISRESNRVSVLEKVGKVLLDLRFRRV